LLFRYGATDNGSIVKKAHIYTQEEHGIDAHLVDTDAMWVLRGLRKEGFSAYVVGGAVRDMIVGRTPNDFDIATDAHPQQIRRIFRSARIIGRRFRIVHVYCGREKYIEVTTFRSRSAIGTSEHTAHPDQNNFFGTMEEDAERRDFTINALYYNPIDRQVIDYVGGVPDIRARRLKTLDVAETSFAEDPVRMIRAVKYASLVGFPVPGPMAGLIRRMRESLLGCSRERVTEEVFKILTSGAAAAILELAHKLRLFEVMFPTLAENLRESRKKFADHPFALRLLELDARTEQGKLLDRNDMFGFLFKDLVLARPDLLQGDEPGYLIQQYIRDASEPLFPSKKDLAIAADALLKEGRPHYRPAAIHPPRGREGPPRQAHAAAGETDKLPGTKRRRHRRGRGRRRGRSPGAGPAAAIGG
jgi:poly(A) polymerase